MCAIYGCISRKGPLDSAVWRRMGDAVRHRGPDDQGEVILTASESCVSLGHKRLSIIDLSQAGRQPMCNEDESIWITFNGEIYNYQHLTQELQSRGHRFRSRSDTEVVLHLYEEHGTECLQQLCGMFAFALWDTNHNLLFLA